MSDSLGQTDRRLLYLPAIQPPVDSPQANAISMSSPMQSASPYHMAGPSTSTAPMELDIFQPKNIKLGLHKREPLNPAHKRELVFYETPKGPQVIPFINAQMYTTLLRGCVQEWSDYQAKRDLEGLNDEDG